MFCVNKCPKIRINLKFEVKLHYNNNKLEFSFDSQFTVLMAAIEIGQK